MGGTLALVDCNGGSVGGEPSPAGNVVNLLTNLEDGVTDKVLECCGSEASLGGVGSWGPAASGLGSKVCG